MTLYSIDTERSFKAATKVLDPGYRGVIVRDGWQVYPCYRQAVHQSCAAHLLRRAHGLIEAKARGSSTVPTLLRDLLVDALALRDRREAGGIDPADYQTGVVALEQRLAALLARRGHTEENRRLLKHLHREKDAPLTFLRHEGVDATNWRAEQGVRPGVVNRKVWDGSRTQAGARTQERLASLLRTAASRERTLSPSSANSPVERPQSRPRSPAWHRRALNNPSPSGRGR